jgi:uncharacterized membrane protein
VPTKSASRQAERQTSRATAAACVGSVSKVVLFVVGISPTLEKLHKGTAFFAYMQVFYKENNIFIIFFNKI